MRIALGIEYDGSDYHGWQSQQNLITLQTTLEDAVSKIANESVQVICAGRTDAGVHATNQIIHFDTIAQRKPEAWVFGVNSHLPRTMSVNWVQEVEESFHARFSALSRRYQYIIYNHPTRPSLLSSQVTWHHQHLDEKRMHEAGQVLLGEHDFSSFRAADCQSRTAKRFVFALKIYRINELVIMDIVANGFLHHMVRNIMGVLMEIGEERKPVAWCKEVLEKRSRASAARTASPYGLYLTGAKYPDQFNFRCEFREPLFLKREQ